MRSDVKHKVVFQLSNNDTFVHKSLIRQIHNALTAMDQLTVEVVAHGYGIDFLLKDTLFRKNISELHRKGVHFLVCKNTLEQEKFDVSGLLPFSEVINSGVAHVIKRQAEGWSYINATF